MFSERSRWALSTNRLTRAALSRRAAGLCLDDLTAANPTRAGLVLPTAHDEAFAQLSSHGTRAYEPDPRGLSVAREAVAGYYASRGQRVDPAQITLTASTSEAYGWIFKLLCDAGDEVIVLHPSYPLFDDLAKLEGVRLVPVSLVYEGRWELDLDALCAAVTARTRAILLVHPNNPTGSFVRSDERAALAALCVRHNLVLVADEVFADHAYAPDASRVASFVEVTEALTFTLSGLSKVVAAPQIKLGWIVVSGPERETREATERIEMIADCYLSVSSPAQHAALSFLSCWKGVRDALLDRVTRNRAALRAALGESSPATLLRAEGGWYATLRVPRTMGEEDRAVVLVERDGVLVHPGYFFDFAREAHLVLSLLPQEEVFARAVGRLCEQVARE